jgi:hypothetical protein
MINTLTVMNYNLIYTSLINRAKSRQISGYVETHHILPRCMGGLDDPSNLVKLTAREHFIAHMLLVKIHPSNLKLVKAVAMMCAGQHERKLTNRLYGNIRTLFSRAMSEGQSGTKNSQFGTMWIHNASTFVAKKIKVDSLVEEGWVLGRYPKREIPKTESIRDTIRAEQIKIHREYYKIYQEVGFDEFVKQTGYKSSKQNLVQRFAKLLDDFEPQNGKRRG